MEDKTPQKPLIYQRMANIMKACNAIEKGSKNKEQGYQFRGIDDVMNKLHNILAENEVFITFEVLDIKRENRLTKSGSTWTYTYNRIKFNFVTIDGSSVFNILEGEAADSADKSTNKTYSAALKYALLITFLIPTVGEMLDPDENTPPELIPNPQPKVKKEIVNNNLSKEAQGYIATIEALTSTTDLQAFKASIKNSDLLAELKPYLVKVYNALYQEEDNNNKALISQCKSIDELEMLVSGINTLEADRIKGFIDEKRKTL